MRQQAHNNWRDPQGEQSSPNHYSNPSQPNAQHSGLQSSNEDDGSNNWQALRANLVSLLGQVESQVSLSRNNSPNNNIPNYSQPQYQQTSQQAPNYQNARPSNSPQMPNHNNEQRFDDFSQTLSSISSRIEQFEGSLGYSSQVNPELQQITNQVDQLAQVIEQLTSAVVEGSSFKQFENQIENIIQTLNDAPEVNYKNLNKRLDSLSQNIEQLSKLQAQNVEQISQIHEKNSHEDTNKSASLGNNFEDGLAAIKESVASVFERIDVLEKNLNLSPQDIERLFQEMGTISAQTAIISEQLNDGRSDNNISDVLSRIDTLTKAIGQVKNQDEVIGELQIELVALHENIRQALDPNFSKLEMRIKELSDNIKENPSKKSIERLEGQVQQLISNSNHTNEQLDIITKKANEAISSTQSDFNNNSANPALLKEIATKISQLSKVFEDQTSDESFNNVQYGIEQVDDRLAKLEAIINETGTNEENIIVQQAPLKQPAPLKSEQTSKTLQSKLNNSLVNDSAQNVELALEDIRRSFAQNNIQKDLQEGLQEDIEQNTVVEAEQNTNESHLPNNGEDNYKTSTDNELTEHFSNNDHQTQNIPLIDDEYDFSDENEEELGHSLSKEFDSIIHGEVTKNNNEVHFDNNEIAPLNDEKVTIASKEPINEKPAIIESKLKSGYSSNNPINHKNEKPAKPKSIFEQDAPSSFNHEVKHETINAAPVHQRIEQASTEIEQASTNNFTNQPVKNSSKNTFIEAARRASMLQNKPLEVEEKQSFIAKGLSRFKRDGLSKSTNKPKEQNEKIANEKDNQSLQTDKSTLNLNPISLLKRLTKNNKDQTKSAAPSKNVELEQPPVEQDIVPQNNSFISRYRRSFLLASALVVVIVLSLNLLTKRGDVSDNPQLAKNNDIEEPATIKEPANTIIPKEKTQDNELLDSGAEPFVLIDNTSTGAIGQNDELPISQVRIINQAIPLSLTSNSPQETISETQVASDIASLINNEDKLIEIDASKFIKDFNPLETALELPDEKIGPLALREAAANGDPRAQFEVGAIYGEGKALKQDFASAAIWFERAAANGFAPASLRLGGLYESGKGVERNYEQAKLWYLRSAEAGNRMAMHNLASLYAGGELGEQKFLQATEWFERAAKYGLTDSQFNLGMLHARGLGVKQDLETAYFWFSLAAKNGDKDALKAKDDVARSLNSDIVIQLQTKISNWEREKINLKANFAPIGTWAKDFNPGQKIKSANVVEKVQPALKRLGFDVGEPDGLMGPRTRAAIKEFEKATGMSLSGEVNPRLLAVLGSQPV